MVRTVRVRLELDRNDYKQGLRESAAETRTFDGEVKTLGKDAERTGVELKDTGTSARKLGDDVKRSSRDVIDLRGSIDDTRKSLRDLGDEYQRTGSVELDRYRKLTGELRKLERAKKDLDKLKPDDPKQKRTLLDFAIDEWVVDLAKATSRGIQSGFDSAGKAIASNPVISTAIIVGIVAGLPIIVSLLGTAIGTGVALGFGGGVIAAGIKMAAADTRVSAAWGALANDARARFTEASGPFVQPLIDGARKVRAAFDEEVPQISAAFARLAPVVADLIDGAAGFIRNLGPGLDKLANFSAPFLQDLAAWLPELGAHLSEFIDRISNAGPGVRMFFNDVLDLVLGVVDALGILVQWGAKVYEVFSAFGSLITGHLDDFRQRLIDLGHESAKSYGGFHNDTINASTALGLLNGTMEKTASGGVIMTDNLSKAAAALNTTKVTADSLAGSMVDKLVGGMLSADQAANNFDKSLVTLGDTLVANGGHLSDHVNKLKQTETGAMQNKDAIYAVIQANLQQYDSMIKVGFSAEDAAAKYGENTRALEDQMRAAGMTQGEIDGLIGKYRNVPDKVNTDIAIHGLTEAINNLEETIRLINGLQSRTVYVDVVQRHSTVGGPSPIARGGVVSYAQGGVHDYKMSLSTDYTARSGLLKPSNPGTILAGEPSTGGEVFGPRLGVSHERGLALAGVLAGWHGGMVVRPAATATTAGGGGPLSLEITFRGDDDFGRMVSKNVRYEVRTIGAGNVQATYGRRGT